MIADLANQAQAAEVAQRLLNSFEQPFLMGEQSLLLSASIGIAVFPGDAQVPRGSTRRFPKDPFRSTAREFFRHRIDE